MPTYDYKCSNCNYTFEYFQPMSSELLTECPQCKGNLKRIIGSGAGPIFKGSGFYQTDYKSKSAPDKNVTKTEKTPEKPKENTDKKATKDEKK
jgi:putative FmdB family regulatory protein